MTSPTHGNSPAGRSADPADDDDGSRAGSGEPAEEARPASSSAAPSASGKQFERGTEAVPAHEPETGAGLGPGASASGKRFARGTDSDGDGVGFDEAPGDSRT